MCIIMYAKTNQTIGEKKIRTAFINNPDGAGIMWYDRGGKVHYRKGFDKAENLIEFFKSLGTDIPRAIHCRIATSGKVSTRTCHPFPIVDSFNEMGKEKGVPKFGAMMHNGIFSRYTPTGGMKSDYSDTMNYNKQVIYPLVKNKAISNEGVINLLSEMTSRVLLFLPNFIVGRFGAWTEDKEEGFLASNDTYDHERFIYTYPTYYTNYDSPNWWKEKKSSVTTTNPIIIKPQYTYSIMVNAKSYCDACDLMETFIDKYRGCIVDENFVIETLTSIDTNIYEFSFDAYRKLEELQDIKDPYFILYIKKI